MRTAGSKKFPEQQTLRTLGTNFNPYWEKLVTSSVPAVPLRRHFAGQRTISATSINYPSEVRGIPQLLTPKKWLLRWSRLLRAGVSSSSQRPGRKLQEKRSRSHPEQPVLITTAGNVSPERQSPRPFKNTLYDQPVTSSHSQPPTSSRGPQPGTLRGSEPGRPSLHAALRPP